MLSGARSGGARPGLDLRGAADTGDASDGPGWDEGRTVEVMPVECGRACLTLPVSDRMSYRPVPVLHRLVRGWSFDLLYAGGACSVQPVAVFDQSLASPDVGFCDGFDTAGAFSDLLGGVQACLGAPVLDGTEDRV